MTKTMKVKNLTPHPVDVRDLLTGTFRRIRVHGPAARLAVHREQMGVVSVQWDGSEPGGDLAVRLSDSLLGGVEELPAQEPDTLLLVSRLVAEARPDRADLVYPGEPVRDADGRIVGCAGLSVGPGYRMAHPYETRCYGCGGHPADCGLTVEDGGQWGGQSGCGDLHQWVRVPSGAAWPFADGLLVEAT